MSATLLAETLRARRPLDPSIDHSLRGHVESLRQYIVGALAQEGGSLDAATLDELSESVLAEAVRIAVRWVEEGG